MVFVFLEENGFSFRSISSAPRYTEIMTDETMTNESIALDNSRFNPNHQSTLEEIQQRETMLTGDPGMEQYWSGKSRCGLTLATIGSLGEFSVEAWKNMFPVALALVGTTREQTKLDYLFIHEPNLAIDTSKPVIFLQRDL